MSTLKRLFASLASLALLVTVAGPAFAYNDISGHWAEDFIMRLADEGIVDGSKTSYNPDQNLTRAELTKMAVEAFLSVDADVIPDTPSYDDVSPDAWYYDYIETALAYDIVKLADNFRPNDPITRAEALKILEEAALIATKLNPASTYSDVSSSDWYYGYVTTAVNHCIVDGSKAMFYPNNNITRAEVAKIVLNTLDVSNGVDLCGDEVVPADDDDDDVVVPADDDDDDVVVGPSDGTLEVSISSESPLAKSVPKGGSNVPFLVLDFTAGSGEAVEVVNLTVSHSGLGNVTNDIDEAKIFDGFNQLGSGRSFTSDEKIAPINLNSEPIEVPASATKTIVIAADIFTEDDGAQTGGEHSFSIDSADDVVAIGAETGGDVPVTGDFPIQGATMTLASVDVGTLDFEFKTVADDQLEVGETDQELCRFQVSAGSAEDVLLQAFTLEFNGPNQGDIGNMYIEFQGERISDIVDFTKNEKATFDLTGLEDGGFLLEDGDTKTLRCKGDILSGVDETLTVKFDEIQTDVIATGLTYGFGVRASETEDSDPQAIGIKGGDIVFSINSTSRSVANDTNLVSFGTLTISNMGEAIEIQKGMQMRLVSTNVLCGDNPDTVDVETPKDGIEDVRLVNLDNGSTMFGPNDPVGAGDNPLVTFSDQAIVEQGEVLILDIVADVTQVAVEGCEYNFELLMNTIDVEGIISGDDTSCGTEDEQPHDCKPKTNNPDTKVYTVQKPAIDITGKTLKEDTYVSKGDNKLFWQGTFTANDSEDLVVRKVEFAFNGDDHNDIQECALYTKEGTVLTMEQQGEDVTAGNTLAFSALDDDGTSGISIMRGDEVDVLLKCSIASTLSDSDIDVSFDLNEDEIEVEDEEGDDATVNNTANLDGTDFTLVENGRLTVLLKPGNSPDSAILVADGSDVAHTVAAFELSADNENVNIQDLTVAISEIVTDDGAGGIDTLDEDVLEDKDAIDRVALFYADGTPILKTNGSEAQTSAVSAGEAFLQDLDFTVEDGDDVLMFVKVYLNEISDSDTAESGMAFSVKLSFDDTKHEIRGEDSGEEYSDADIEVDIDDAADDPAHLDIQANDATDSGEVMYVLRNQVIAEHRSSTTSLANQDQGELLKFDLVKSDDTSDAFLRAVTVTISLSDAGADLTDLELTDLTLRNDDNEIIASMAGDSSGTNTLTVADSDGGGAVAVNADTTTLDGQEYDEIDGASETYILRGDIAGVSDNDKITVTIEVNAAKPGLDGITWRDEGTDNGTDGIDIQWIDLGDSSTTQIQNILVE